MFCLHMCLCTMCTQYLWRPDKGIRTLELESWELNMGGSSTSALKHWVNPPATHLSLLIVSLQICVCIGSHLHTCTCKSKRPTPGIYFSCSPAHFLRWLTLGFTEPESSSILLDWPANELRHLLVSPTSSTWSWKTCAAVEQLWHER